ncbi:hypothetical protein B566_EDAN011129 [Ephemera danica]|nr:hypothetical protein B566_EDAN011129 [Ephemera danica]
MHYFVVFVAIILQVFKKKISTDLTEPDITDSTTQQCLILTESGMGDLGCTFDHNFICEQQGL